MARLQRLPHAMASWQNALQCMNSGRHAPAMATLHNLAQQFPGIPQLWLQLGLAASGNLEFGLADQCFQRALDLAPRDASLLIAVGAQYYHLHRLDEALDCFQRAVAANSSVNMRLNLAAWLERYRRLDEALECVETCLTEHPKDGAAQYFKAFLLHRKGLNSEAETVLRDLLRNNPSLPPNVQADAHYLLGVVLDAFGQYAEALSCLGKAKALRSQTMNMAAFEKMSETGNRARRELLAGLTTETIQRWRGEAAHSPCPHPLALLGGAMRSGTTLIEQILGAHPETLAFGEPPSFAKEVLAPLQPPPPEPWLTLKTLNDLPAIRRIQLIGRYFKSLLRGTEEQAGAKLLVDKNPDMTAWLHVWLRLFPESKVVIALRDPRDVIISCYFQNILQDWAIFNFSNPERTARFYANWMDVWLRLRDLGGFDWIETRYEDVVNNLEAEGRRVTSFLGLPWHEGQATYYEKARRKFVHSPTYNDVTKPVYTRAVKRWEHYAEALAPVQAGLQPYLRAFGY